MALLILGLVFLGLVALFIIPGSTPRIDPLLHANSVAVLAQVLVNYRTRRTELIIAFGF